MIGAIYSNSHPHSYRVRLGGELGARTHVCLRLGDATLFTKVTGHPCQHLVMELRW
jgi:hypothetical protein